MYENYAVRKKNPSQKNNNCDDKTRLDRKIEILIGNCLRMQSIYTIRKIESKIFNVFGYCDDASVKALFLFHFIVFLPLYVYYLRVLLVQLFAHIAVRVHFIGDQILCVALFLFFLQNVNANDVLFFFFVRLFFACHIDTPP